MKNRRTFKKVRQLWHVCIFIHLFVKFFFVLVLNFLSQFIEKQLSYIRKKIISVFAQPSPTVLGAYIYWNTPPWNNWLLCLHVDVFVYRCCWLLFVISVHVSKQLEIARERWFLAKWKYTQPQMHVLTHNHSTRI